MDQQTPCYQLQSCVWEITLACCFSCQYCGPQGGKAKENELTTQECFSVADQLAELGCRRVSLIGDEVFLRPDWSQIVERLTSQGIKVAIITNGFLFTEQIIQTLLKTGVESVAVSIDGTEAIHDRYRQVGSYQRVIRAVETLTGHGIPVSIITTLNADNIGCLNELYEVLKRWSIYAWQLQACSPMGNAAKHEIDYHFDSRKVIQFVQSNMFTAPFMIGVADNIGYYTDMEGYLRGNLSGLARFAGCRAGISSIGIDSVGNVRGCESMYDTCFNEGNLRERTLREIWEDPDAFAYNRKFRQELLTGGCAHCPHGTVCRGGCRSYNFFVHRKLYESPVCAHLSGEHI